MLKPFAPIDVSSFRGDVPVARIGLQTLFYRPGESWPGAVGFKLGKYTFAWNGLDFDVEYCASAYTLHADNPHAFGELQRYLRQYWLLETVEAVVGPAKPLYFGG